MRERTAPRQAGFALLLTLMLVMIAGVALTAVARKSIESAVEARTEVEDLQYRWAVKSIHAALHGRIGMCLDAAEKGGARPGASTANATGQRRRHPQDYTNAPQPQLRIDCSLGNVDYTLVLCDEQARVNVNRLLDETSLGRTHAAVGRLARLSHGVDSGPVEIMLRPLPERGESRGALPRLGSYGQVFGNARPSTLLGTGSGGGLVNEITCWGDGKLNIRRVSEQALLTLSEKVVGRHMVRRLIRVRDRDPYVALVDMLQELDLTDSELEQLTEYVTDVSLVHSVWIVEHGIQGPRYAFAVEVGASVDGEMAPAPVQRHEFMW